MAPAQSARAKRLAALGEKLVKDCDPEANNAPVESDSRTEDEDEDEDDDDGAAETEHYVSVGKSKLRQQDPPALDSKYRGVRISRSALDDSSDSVGSAKEDEEENDSEEYDDPETADLERGNIIDDEEIDSEGASDDGEEEMLRKKEFGFQDSNNAVDGPEPVPKSHPKRAGAASFISSSASEYEVEIADMSPAGKSRKSGEDSSSETDDGFESRGVLPEGEAKEPPREDESDKVDHEDEDEHDEGDNVHDANLTDHRSTLRVLMQEGQKSAIATIIQAAKADAEKGVAIRQQRRTYDSLLNLRIRLQKGLVAINSLSQVREGGDATAKEPYEAAEEAAIKLWTDLNGCRATLLPESQARRKRKRDFDASTSNEELWQDMQTIEEQAVTKRNKVLEKWSSRVKNTTATLKARQLGPATGSQSIVSVLEGHMLNSARLIKRTQIPRSCAPIQAAKKMAEDTSIYDDAEFYQLLLRELVDQRSNDSSSSGGGGGIPTVQWAATKEAKTRKQVDRRASKGRKLRFTVHEKLQNFMAAEDRRSWPDDAIDRLFGALFGQRMQLREDVSGEEGEDHDIAVHEEGLRMFRN